MGKINIYLRNVYELRLRLLSMDTGKSMAELVREALDMLFEKYFDRLAKYKKFIEVVERL